MRSALTALGVIIGVGAVIAMTEIGQGSKIALQKTIASMGANNLLIMPGWAITGSVNFGSGTHPIADPWRHERDLPAVPCGERRGPHCLGTRQVIYGNRNWIPRNMTGTTPDYLAVRDWEDLEEGNAFTDGDVQQGRQGLPDRHHAEAGAVPGRIAGRQGGPHPERSLPRGRRAQPQGRQHDGPGPGRHRAGALDHDQVPGERQRRGQHDPDCLSDGKRPDRDQHLVQFVSRRNGAVPRATPTEVFDVPQAARRVNVDQTPGQGRQRGADPPGHPGDRPTCSASGTIFRRRGTTTSTFAT